MITEWEDEQPRVAGRPITNNYSLNGGVGGGVRTGGGGGLEHVYLVYRQPSIEVITAEIQGPGCISM